MIGQIILTLTSRKKKKKLGLILLHDITPAVFFVLFFVTILSNQAAKNVCSSSSLKPTFCAWTLEEKKSGAEVFAQLSLPVLC